MSGLNVAPELESTSNLKSQVENIFFTNFADDEFVYLSRFGFLIAKATKERFEELSGGLKLKEYLEREFNGRVSFQGGGGETKVSLAKSSFFITDREEKRYPRFDPTIWAAFSKAPSAEYERYVKVTQPFGFKDHIKDSLDVGDGIKIPNEFFAQIAGEKSKIEKDIKVSQIISEFCGTNKINIADLYYKGSSLSASSRNNVSVLRNFIEAIPQEKRSNISLSVDIILGFIR